VYLHHLTGQGFGSVVKNSVKNIRSFFPKGLLCTGGMKKSCFRQIYGFISETILDMAIVTMEDE